MFYINQLLTSSFTIGFVKIESGFIVRSVETGLQRWGLVVAVIIVELMLILFWLSQTWPVSFRIQELVFFGYTVLPDSKEIELESNNQEGSPSAGKNSRVVLVPYLHMEVHPYSFCGGVDVSEVLGCHFLQQMSFQWGPQKLPQGLLSWTHSLPFYF